MTAAETNAFVSVLRSNPALANKVYISDATDNSGNPITDSWYIIVHPGQGSDEQLGLTGPYAVAYPSFNVQAVASTALQCQLAMDKVDATCRPGGQGVAPSVPGRRTEYMRRDILGVVDRDRDINPPLYYQPAEYSFRSAPA